MNKIEHIGIAVKEPEKAKQLFELLLSAPSYKTERVESEQVNTHFFRLGPNKIELLEATSQESVIAKYLDKKGEGIHHIAIAVADIDFEMKRLQAHGFQFLLETPKKGADNKLINFIHPKSAGGVLIELCQEMA